MNIPLHLLSPLLTTMLARAVTFTPRREEEKKRAKLRIISTVCGSVLLVFGIASGSQALYYYLITLWTPEYALAVISGAFLLLGCVFFLVRRALSKPITYASQEVITHLEKEISNLSGQDIMKKLVDTFPPKTLLTLFSFIAIVSCIKHFKKSHIT